jgi:hypothetical protein
MRTVSKSDPEKVLVKADSTVVVWVMVGSGIAPIRRVS